MRIRFWKPTAYAYVVVPQQGVRILTWAKPPKGVLFLNVFNDLAPAGPAAKSLISLGFSGLFFKKNANSLILKEKKMQKNGSDPLKFRVTIPILYMTLTTSH